MSENTLDHLPKGEQLTTPIDINRLNWGDWIKYTQASGWYHDGVQPKEGGPYIGGIVGFEDDSFGVIIQVRADGWMGEEPIYALRLRDIIAVLPARRNTDAYASLTHEALP